MLRRGKDENTEQGEKRLRPSHLDWVMVRAVGQGNMGHESLKSGWLIYRFIDQ